MSHIPQPEIKNPQPDQISEDVVMASNAGWYVGRVYYNASSGCWLPYDRSSDYASSREEAESLLLEELQDDLADAEEYYSERRAEFRNACAQFGDGWPGAQKQLQEQYEEIVHLRERIKALQPEKPAPAEIRTPFVPADDLPF